MAVPDDDTLRNRQYRALLESMSEGFALVDAICDAHGHLVDYTIVEINPALQRMLGVGPEVIGTRLDQRTPREWIRACARVLRTGEPLGWDFANPLTGRTHAIRVNKVDDHHLAQFFFDITEREEARRHQAVLFDELNHRVKNNLALVIGLLGVQARNADEAVRRELLKAMSRVQSIADIHANLYKGPYNDRIRFDAYLHDLCAGIAGTMLDRARVTLAVDAAPVELLLDKATPLGMAVNELVLNAAKHAFPDPMTGTIRVSLTQNGPDLVLEVRDDGTGLPASDTPSASIGMKLVRSLTAQATGQLHIGGGPGTTVTIRLPDAAKSS